LAQAVQNGRPRGPLHRPWTFDRKVLAHSLLSLLPHQFVQYRSKSWRNRAIADTFEPGSLSRPFSAAAALEEKVVRPPIPSSARTGLMRVYDRTIHDHSRHGWLTFHKSSSSQQHRASKVGKRWEGSVSTVTSGPSVWRETRLGLSGEGKGILHHPRYWSPGDLNTISFGRDFVTGIQLVLPCRPIANGGF